MKRSKCLGTRVTADEYAALEALAGGQRIGTWAREQLLAVRARPATEETVLREIAALRTIVVNLEFAHLRGETLTAEDVQKLIDRADHGKVRKARAWLAASLEGSSS
ncbi:MAG TPA: hypothetical protein VIX35_02875 [Vicinamibacterales bacterium]